MDLNGTTKVRNSYFIVGGMLLLVILICLFGYRSWGNKLNKESKAKDKVIELLQTEYNNALIIEEDECE